MSPIKQRSCQTQLTGHLSRGEHGMRAEVSRDPRHLRRVGMGRCLETGFDRSRTRPGLGGGRVGARHLLSEARSTMSLFTRRILYDRKRLFEQAEAWVDGRRWRQSLRFYRQILAAEPNNPEIHIRVAPLLSRQGKLFEAWESFRIASEALSLTGESSGLLALHQQAVKVLPRSSMACRELARLQLAHKDTDAALRTLRDGSHRLRGRRTRGEAIVLLRDARIIEPWQPAIVLDLCRLLAREGEAAEALFLLDHLDPRARGQQLLEVRGLSFRIEPSLRHGWRWLRARMENRSAPVAASSRSRA